MIGFFSWLKPEFSKIARLNEPFANAIIYKMKKINHSTNLIWLSLSLS